MEAEVVDYFNIIEVLDVALSRFTATSRPVQVPVMLSLSIVADLETARARERGERERERETEREREGERGREGGREREIGITLPTSRWHCDALFVRSCPF